jgi:hypothetical protein
MLMPPALCLTAVESSREFELSHGWLPWLHGAGFTRKASPRHKTYRGNRHHPNSLFATGETPKASKRRHSPLVRRRSPRAVLSQGHLIASNRPDEIAIVGAFDMTAVDEIAQQQLLLPRPYCVTRTAA